MRYRLIVSLGIILQLISGQCGAVDIGSWLEKAANKIKPKEDEKVSRVLPSTLPLEALQVVDLHEYEQASDDQFCHQLVKPFSYSDNFDSVYKNVISESSKKLVSMLFSKKESKEVKREALETAKISAKQLNWLPMDIEIYYGEELNKTRIEHDPNVIQLNDKGPIKRQYQQAHGYLAKVLANIGEETPYEFKILLINNNDINASALPGGYLHINTGVLKSGHAELVLAHEIAHVLKRHQTYETQARLIDSIETVDELKKLVKGNKKALLKAVEKAVELYGSIQNFSRQQELQADACAVQLAGRIPELNIFTMIDGYTVSVAKQVEPQQPTDKELPEKVITALNLLGSGHPKYPERKKRMLDVVNDMQMTAKR